MGPSFARTGAFKGFEMSERGPNQKRAHALECCLSDAADY